MKSLAGIFAPIGTPFREDEEIDFGALEGNLAFYARSGILGYVTLGSNGENKSLTEDEKLAVLRAVVVGRAPSQLVVAGATYEAQRDTERFLHLAAEAGADFALLLAPSYFRKQMTDDVLFRYFSTTAESSPLPLLVYNAPGFSGLALSPALVGRLAEHPNIVGMKDSAASGIENFLAFERQDFHVLAGSVNFLFPAMMQGSLGGTVSLADAFPAIAQRLYHYGVERDEAVGVPFQEYCRRLNEGISGRYGVPGVKAAMTLAGLQGGLPRRPLLPLADTEVAALRAFLVKEGALDG